jgi:outer membrane protein, heavy metal efflux system
VSGPASVTLAHRTDRLTGNGGLRELEAEVAVPLWTAGTRSATRAQVDADRTALERQHGLARQLEPGDVRELAAQVALAQVELSLATRKLQDSTALAQDVDRRVRAGDAARVDALQAQSAVQQATSTLAHAQAALTRAHSQWRAMTGLVELPSVTALDSPTAVASIETPLAPDHPVVASAMAQAQAARSRLALAEADRRDPMELSLGSTRERSAVGASAETALRVALKIPLGGDSRNGPRIAAARAELDTADAEADAVARQVNADLAAARADVLAAQASERAAEARARLSAEAQDLFAKSYRLGDSDLPTRLRADNERFEADLALARTRIETRRALARLHQSLGSLP